MRVAVVREIESRVFQSASQGKIHSGQPPVRKYIHARGQANAVQDVAWAPNARPRPAHGMGGRGCGAWVKPEVREYGWTVGYTTVCHVCCTVVWPARRLSVETNEQQHRER